MLAALASRRARDIHTNSMGADKNKSKDKSKQIEALLRQCCSWARSAAVMRASGSGARRRDNDDDAALVVAVTGSTADICTAKGIDQSKDLSRLGGGGKGKSRDRGTRKTSVIIPPQPAPVDLSCFTFLCHLELHAVMPSEIAGLRMLRAQIVSLVIRCAPFDGSLRHLFEDEYDRQYHDLNASASSQSSSAIASSEDSTINDHVNSKEDASNASIRTLNAESSYHFHSDSPEATKAISNSHTVVTTTSWTATSSAAAMMAWPVLKTLNVASNGLLSILHGRYSDELLGRLLPRLLEIDFSCNAVDSLQSLMHLPHTLTKLNLNSNMINSVIGISAVLGNIAVLSLRYNTITSIDGLQYMYSLNSLDLRDNLIADLDHTCLLGKLPLLTELWLKGNPICSKSVYRTRILSSFHERCMEVILDGKAPNFVESLCLHTILQEELSITPVDLSSQIPNAAAAAPIALNIRTVAESTSDLIHNNQSISAVISYCDSNEQKRISKRKRSHVACIEDDPWDDFADRSCCQSTCSSTPAEIEMKGDEGDVMDNNSEKNSICKENHRTYSPILESTSTSYGMSEFQRNIEALRAETGDAWLKVFSEIHHTSLMKCSNMHMEHGKLAVARAPSPVHRAPRKRQERRIRAVSHEQLLSNTPNSSHSITRRRAHQYKEKEDPTLRTSNGDWSLLECIQQRMENSPSTLDSSDTILRIICSLAGLEHLFEIHRPSNISNQTPIFSSSCTDITSHVSPAENLFLVCSGTESGTIHGRKRSLSAFVNTPDQSSSSLQTALLNQLFILRIIHGSSMKKQSSSFSTGSSDVVVNTNMTNSIQKRDTNETGQIVTDIEEWSLHDGAMSASWGIANSSIHVDVKSKEIYIQTDHPLLPSPCSSSLSSSSSSSEANSMILRRFKIMESENRTAYLQRMLQNWKMYHCQSPVWHSPPLSPIPPPRTMHSSVTSEKHEHDLLFSPSLTSSTSSDSNTNAMLYPSSSAKDCGRNSMQPPPRPQLRQRSHVEVVSNRAPKDTAAPCLVASSGENARAMPPRPILKPFANSTFCQNNNEKDPVQLTIDCVTAGNDKLPATIDSAIAKTSQISDITSSLHSPSPPLSLSSSASTFERAIVMENDNQSVWIGRQIPNNLLLYLQLTVMVSESEKAIAFFPAFTMNNRPFMKKNIGGGNFDVIRLGTNHLPTFIRRSSTSTTSTTESTKNENMTGLSPLKGAGDGFMRSAEKEVRIFLTNKNLYVFDSRRYNQGSRFLGATGPHLYSKPFEDFDAFVGDPSNHLRLSQVIEFESLNAVMVYPNGQKLVFFVKRKENSLISSNRKGQPLTLLIKDSSRASMILEACQQYTTSFSSTGTVASPTAEKKRICVLDAKASFPLLQIMKMHVFSALSSELLHEAMRNNQNHFDRGRLSSDALTGYFLIQFRAVSCASSFSINSKNNADSSSIGLDSKNKSFSFASFLIFSSGIVAVCEEQHGWERLAADSVQSIPSNRNQEGCNHANEIVAATKSNSFSSPELNMAGERRRSLREIMTSTLNLRSGNNEKGRAFLRKIFSTSSVPSSSPTSSSLSSSSSSSSSSSPSSPSQSSSSSFSSAADIASNCTNYDADNMAKEQEIDSVQIKCETKDEAPFRLISANKLSCLERIEVISNMEILLRWKNDDGDVWNISCASSASCDELQMCLKEK